MEEYSGTTESVACPSSPGLSSHDDDMDEDKGGDYSTRMEELFDDDEQQSGIEGGGEDEEFVYDGVDAEQVTRANYREQLRDVLGPEDTSDIFEEEEIERSLLREDISERSGDINTGEPKHTEITPDSTSLPQSLLSQSAMVALAPEPSLTPLQPVGELSESFLPPSASRLRSSLLRDPLHEPTQTFFADVSPGIGFLSPPSRVSDLSRSSTPAIGKGSMNGYLKAEREVFKWTVLQNAADQLYGKRPSKAALILGAPNLGSPTVLTANGLICVGTDAGRVFVFDFKQTLLGICGNETSASTVGATSAIALSHDHTYLASGHVSGYIQIFDLKNPQTPARVVTPPSIQGVMSGRHEGHLAGSRIVSVSFVAGRHTAIISADESGLAFYHSLGKVLFVEASDTIRILGTYPEEPVAKLEGPPGAATNGHGVRSFRRRRTRNALLAMTILPLGTVAHPTDTYQIVALLTSNKLVMVGLKPSPKTWLKRARDDDVQPGSFERRRGTLAWFPSVKDPHGSREHGSDATRPILAYSWGRTVYLMRVSETMVKQPVFNSRTEKTREVDMGALVFEDAGKWAMDDTVLALQWLNVNQLTVFTTATLSIYDIRTSKLVEHVPLDASGLVSRSLNATADGSVPYFESLSDVAHSIRTYKGKIFLLCREELRVGTLLTWADKILSLVEQGDFLSAIELTRSYYTGEAPGNRNGLPEDAQEQKEVLGQKLHELMVASASYAFSEDRMTDGTHTSPDGRGVDRTSLFEGLVTTCARACIALDNLDFLFEDLFQHFEDAGIARIYLEQLETFVLAGTIDFVPPRITQRLVALHDDNGQPALAERVIWHIDPSCLDINQAIRLCQTHQLWDALIYVYTRALQDYVAPIVELIALIRKLSSLPEDTSLSGGSNGGIPPNVTPSPRHAYKIFPYIINVLCGQTYPSGEPLPFEEAEKAKKDVYRFIFNGTSAVWPEEGGRLVLTCPWNRAEPTYPYARFLLRFDSESFLHSLDIAFEDSFLTDSQDINRLSIIKILLDIVSHQDLPLSAITFINIFIARNVPKYPQHIRVKDFESGVLHDLLISLATPPDPGTREDRQLAAEYLLSAYAPRDISEIEKIFENAGFYRILQNRRRQERQWTRLLSSYLLDPGLQTPAVLSHVEEVLGLSRSDNHNVLPEDMKSALSDSLGHLLSLDMRSTASLVDRFAPSLHEAALGIMDPEDDRRRYDYLLHLIDPPVLEREDTTSPSHHPHLNETLCRLFIKLKCRYMPSGVINTLDYLRSNLDWPVIEQICEENQAYGAVLWALNQRGRPRDALAKAEAFEKQLTENIARAIVSSSSNSMNVDDWVNALGEIGRRGAAICLEHSRTSASAEIPLEDVWFQLLSSQLHTVQVLSNLHLADDADGHRLKNTTLSSVRDLVQNTFASLVTISSTRAVSFPRLFKRLVDPGKYASSSGTPYTEFRTILTGMLESYRSDGDMLSISQRLLDRDVFDTVEEFTKEKMRGWSSQHICSRCHRTLLQHDGPGGTEQTNINIIVTRTAIYHASCPP